MRWIVTLSSALVLSLSVNAAADQQVRTFQGQAGRQPGSTITQGSPSARYQGQVIPGTMAPAQVALATQDQAAAPVPATPAPVAQSAPVVYSPQPQYYYQPVQRRSQGPFARLMELERRKNAWLMSLFR